ncbi:MAG: hypothetical protein L0215_18970 [Gemmataceae bacterium]|nr:hypothetical protein [Gemmataceae bacterium]
MYQAFGLLKPDTNFTLAAAAKKLAGTFPGWKLEQAPSQITLSKDAWEIHLRMRDGPEVLEESRRIADHIGGADEELGISSCSRRVEVASDMPDPEMDHFNDYLMVIEVLQSFQGLIPVDPQEPSLL